MFFTQAKRPSNLLLNVQARAAYFCTAEAAPRRRDARVACAHFHKERRLRDCSKSDDAMASRFDELPNETKLQILESMHLLPGWCNASGE